jgi:predicted small secreted protein
MRAAVLLLIVAVFALAACNTIGGFGRDVEKVGESIQRKSSR